MGSPLRMGTDFISPTPMVLHMHPEVPNRAELDSRVVLFPTIATPTADGEVWRVWVQGRICQEAPASFSKRLMLKGLVRALDISKEVVDGQIFNERVDGFLACPVPGERIQVALGGQHYVLRRKSKGSGLFNCKLDLPARQISGLRRFGEPSPFSLHEQIAAPLTSPLLDAAEVLVGCPIFLAEDRGVSVVTDIDDTIKLTEVNFRRRMLQRTFAEPFESIEGMAETYQRWSEQGALFHYVSSSPWQIYRPISRFLLQAGFPQGSMHLKWFRLRDEIFKRWQIIRRKSKGGVIRSLLKRMPNRTFLFVGDSGERDPEIYAKLASKFPKQVARICIRQIEANPLDSKRLDAIYRRHGLTVPIQVFANARQLGDLLS
ncbi:phosphatidate phosphatase App1 family protein [Pirellulaceae bacterium SH501]